MSISLDPRYHPLRRRNPIPYPLRAARIALELKPFGFWFIPRFTYRGHLTEVAKADGQTIWWARWAWFQISYSRWR